MARSPICTERGMMAWLVGIFLLQWACVGGHISPATFHFTNVVGHSGTGQGGWKVAQVVVLLGKISTQFSTTANCEIEVGVPEVSLNGAITDAFAQEAAAVAADKAARLVLREWQPTAVMCNQFRRYIQDFLRDPVSGSIPGARVTGFLSVNIPRTTFP